MKKLLVLGLLLTAQFGYANDAATAFITGFANAMNVRMGGQPYQAPPQPVQTVTTVHVLSTPDVRYYDATLDGSTRAGKVFTSYTQCREYLRTAGTVYNDCSIFWY